jgi:hypothetical protein
LIPDSVTIDKENNFVGFKERVQQYSRSAVDVEPSILKRMADEDPESPLNLSQSNNLVFYISRDNSLATRVDDVPCLDGLETNL